MTAGNRRRQVRYPISKEHLVDVKVRQGSQATQGTVAQLCDISRGGARLKLKGPLDLNETTFITLSRDKPSLELSVSGKVCWATSAAEHWLFGFAFVPELPFDVLERLVTFDRVETAICNRAAAGLKLVARWQSELVDRAAYLWDVSKRGFCLLSAGQATEKVIVSPANDGLISVEGMTQWQVRLPAGFAIGCKYSHEHGFDSLASICPPDTEVADPAGVEWEAQSESSG